MLPCPLLKRRTRKFFYKETDMEENSLYVNVLVTSLKKKVSILEDMDKNVKELEKLLKNPDTSVDQVDKIHKEQGTLLKELEKADDGFEQIYNRVKEEFSINKYKYENEIKTMQGYIKTIADLTVKIQAQEIRNRERMEMFFQKKKKTIQSFQYNKRSTEQYYQHMANRAEGQSYFLDRKK